MTHTEWSSENSSQADDLWNALAPEVGMVVVDNGLSRQMDLYDTSTFPWDHGKGHIHARRLPQSALLGQTRYQVCVFNDLRADDFERCTSIERYANSNKAFPQTTPMHHHIHCLDTLRESAIGSADDTLRPTGSSVAKLQGPRRTPQRKCRDWEQLKRWALQNSACFKRLPDDDPRARDSRRMGRGVLRTHPSCLL